MPEQLQLAATQVDDAPVGTRLLSPAPAYLIIILLLLSMLLNSLVVLVVLPSTGGVLVGSPTSGENADNPDYGLRFGDLYDLIATNLAQGHGYRVEPYMGETILREPLYPLLIAGMDKMGANGSQWPRIFSILLAFVAALMLLRLTRKITGNSSIALIASLLFLLYPGTLVAESRAGNEMPCVAGMLLFILVLHQAVEKASLWLFAAAGFVLGVTALVRSEVLMFPLFLGVYFLFSSKGWGARGKAVLWMMVLGASTLVAMSPWIIRNYLLVHEFVPTDTLSGVAAQEGLFTCENLSQYDSFSLAQRAAGRERAEIATQLGLRFEGAYYYQFFFNPQDEMKFNRALLNQVSETYRSNPRILAGCSTENLVFKFWFLGKTPRSTRLNMLVQLPLIVCALGGIVVLYKLGLMQNAAFVLLYIAYIPIIHAPIIAHARHSTLVIAFMTIPISVFLAWAWHSLRTHSLRMHSLSSEG